MKYRVSIPPNVESTVRHLHPAVKGKIREALRTIEENPYAGKGLKGKLTGLMSLKAVHYRIVYRIAHGTRRIEVVDIGPRSTIYERILGFKFG